MLGQRLKLGSLTGRWRQKTGTTLGLYPPYVRDTESLETSQRPQRWKIVSWKQEAMGLILLARYKGAEWEVAVGQSFCRDGVWMIYFSSIHLEVSTR